MCVAVVLANAGFWDWAAVYLWSSHSQDHFWFRCTAVAWKQSRGVHTNIFKHTHILFLVACMVAFGKFADVAITAFLKQMFLLHIFDI